MVWLYTKVFTVAKARGISQKRLAEITGIDESTLSLVRRFQRGMTGDNFIAKILWTFADPSMGGLGWYELFEVLPGERPDDWEDAEVFDVEGFDPPARRARQEPVWDQSAQDEPKLSAPAEG